VQSVGFYVNEKSTDNSWDGTSDLPMENRVLRRIFGPRRGEVTGEWRKLHK